MTKIKPIEEGDLYIRYQGVNYPCMNRCESCPHPDVCDKAIEEMMQ